MYAKRAKPDQTPRSAASDLVLHCFPVSNKKDARLIWGNLGDAFLKSFSIR